MKNKYILYSVYFTLFASSLTGSAQAKAAAEGVSLEDISDDEEDPYELEEEDDISLGSGIVEEEEEVMPSKSTPKKKNPSKKVSTTGGDFSTDMQNLSISNKRSSKLFSMEFKLPYIMNTYNEGTDQMIKIDILVPCLPEEYFIPDVGNGGNVFELSIQVPGFFIDEERVIKKNSSITGFNQNTHEAQSFKDVCEKIDTHYGMTDKVYAEKPLSIDLPFTCEERLVDWEIQGYLNEEVADKFEDNAQYHFVLQARLRKLKTKRRTTGTFRLVDATP
jgi:hypothetical protein